MKATDLMIGDWVLYDGEPNIITEVSGIIHGEATVCFVGNNYMANMDEIEPIPLTAEILEKNGFTNATYTPDSHSKKRYSTLAGSRGFWVEVCIESYFEGEVKYVHELQHILRLCEREKEIEL